MSNGDPSLTKITTSFSIPEGHIDLIDNSAPSELSATFDGELAEQETLELVPTVDSSRRPQSKLIRHQLLKRKYAKQSEARYEGSLGGSRTDVGPKVQDAEREAREGSAEGLIEQDEPESAPRAGKIRRGQKKVKSILKGRRKGYRIKDEDSVVDVLYENQRGSFVLGKPLYSSRSLLNFDPSPWVNSYGRTSSMNITNAQVPDPSWEWAWTTWYVDMSEDVDEQGWQYSFMFQNKFSWHGTHPWFHSFVRRRRWLRKRVRKHPQLAGDKPNGQAMGQGRRLSTNYFSIHPLAENSEPSSVHGDQSNLTHQQQNIHMMDSLLDDIDDLPTLLTCLKKATVDREKINMVLAYMGKASADTHNFAEEIPHILSLFVYQNTRRQLLTSMTLKIDAASDHRAEHKQRHEVESSSEKERLDNLIRAAKAADGEVRKLEYWSDIRNIVDNGESLGPADEASGWEHGWEDIDRSGASRTLRSVIADDDGLMTG